MLALKFKASYARVTAGRSCSQDFGPLDPVGRRRGDAVNDSPGAQSHTESQSPRKDTGAEMGKVAEMAPWVPPQSRNDTPP